MIIKNGDKKQFCEQVISLCEKMHGAYFYNPPSSASSRRSYEKYNSMSGEFNLKGNKYEIEVKTVCSCKNVYFSKDFRVNGVKKNITAIKKALTILSK